MKPLNELTIYLEIMVKTNNIEWSSYLYCVIITLSTNLTISASGVSSEFHLQEKNKKHIGLVHTG